MDQAKARRQLVASASRAHQGGFSMLDWMEHQEVLNYCKQNKLDPKILEHIAYWVWKGLNRS